jgi:ribose/xylose/arabinose/galactoside ABC-type transport system permease subunit/ABC-type branched-subunit amino acid transport system ATPase component
MARCGLAYVPEDRLRQGLCRELSVRCNHMLAALRQFARGPWLSRRVEARRTRAAVAALSVRLNSIEQAIGTLSGGNQQKVVVSRWLEREPTVLILDEPTRGIDVAAKDEIHALIRRLAGEGRAIVLISSDLPEVLGQSDRVGVFRGGRLAEVFEARTATAAQIAAAAMPAQVVPKDGNPVLPTRQSPQTGILHRLPLREAALAGLILLLFVVLQFSNPRFLQPGNVWNLATDSALLCCCTLGVLLVLLVGGIDISLGSVMAFSVAVAGSLWQRSYPLAVVLPVALFVGGLAGAGNAILTLAGRVHPIVITLGSMSLYRGLTQLWIDQDITIDRNAREGLVNPWVGLVLAAGLALLLHGSVLGRQIYAMGSNPAAARRAGISRTKIWLIVFTGQGMLAGLAGLLYLARSGQLQTVSYEDKTLEAIGAAVVGGVAITGGRGSVLGVLLGCLFLVSLGTACQFLHVPTTWQRSLVGLVIVVAVLIDSRWRRRQT